MRLRVLVSVSAICILSPIAVLAEAAVEGHVELPKSHSAPVMAKRYEIVTIGGLLTPQPPHAVLYLDGSFPKSTAPTPTEIAQKEHQFLPSFLPVQVGTSV